MHPTNSTHMHTVVADFGRSNFGRPFGRSIPIHFWPTSVVGGLEKAPAPFQHALSTKSGGECIVHALQTLADLDERATVLSIDGVGAFDLISRGCYAQRIAVSPRR